MTLVNHSYFFEGLNCIDENQTFTYLHIFRNSMLNVQCSIFPSHPEGTPEGSAKVEHKQ